MGFLKSRTSRLRFSWTGNLVRVICTVEMVRVNRGRLVLC